MKSLFQMEDIKSSFQTLVSRFPLETVIVLFTSAILIYSVQKDAFSGWIPRVVFSLIVTLFFLVSVTLYWESKERRSSNLFLPIVPVVYGVGFYFVNSYTGEDDLQSIVFFLLHLFGFALGLFIAPYIARHRSEASRIEHSNYFTSVAWTKLMSGIVGVSVLILGFIAIGSIMELFDLSGDFFRKMYGYWAVASLSLIAPIYALIHFPVAARIEKDSYETNRFFSFLIRFVGIPFIFLYLIILYAYSLRVLMNFHDWPKGIVSWLVIGFSIFGYLIYIFSEPYEKEGKFITLFRRFFPFAVLPQILMLFYAIYLRIAQYDLTMNRYFVVIFGLWLTIVSLYYVFSRKKIILFLPVTLAIISILISFGPWSVFSLPLERQYNRFISNITQVGILQNGKIVPLDREIDAALENEIISEVRYICEFRTCEKLRPLFSRVLEEAENKDRKNRESSLESSSYGKLSSWMAADAIYKVMGVEMRSTVATERQGKYLYVSADYPDQNARYPLEITGFDRLVRVMASSEKNNATTEPYLSIDPETDSLAIHDGIDTETVSLADFTAKLRKECGNRASQCDQKYLTSSIEAPKHTVRLLLDNYVYKNPDYQEKKDNRGEYYSISGIALIKKK